MAKSSFLSEAISFILGLLILKVIVDALHFSSGDIVVAAFVLGGLLYLYNLVVK